MPWFIYKITNLVNQKIYVGKTNNIERRWYSHCYDAKHDCGFYLHRAIRKYDKEAFSISILEAFNDEQTALDQEKSLIKTLNARNPSIGYNIAEGGLGGNTLTQDQIENQRVIKSCDHEKFIDAFNSGLSQREIALLFNVGSRGVISCATRLGLSFNDRRLTPKKSVEGIQNEDVIFVLRQKSLQRELIRSQRRQEQLQRLKISRENRKMSPEAYSQFRSGVMTRVNKSRGISDEMKQRVIDLYFGPEELSAKEIALRLKIGHGSVRCTISSAYATMDNKEREGIKKRRGSSVRSGVKNANSAARRQ